MPPVDSPELDEGSKLGCFGHIDLGVSDDANPSQPLELTGDYATSPPSNSCR